VKDSHVCETAQYTTHGGEVSGRANFFIRIRRNSLKSADSEK
jgi:hypothetical protein